MFTGLVEALAKVVDLSRSRRACGWWCIAAFAGDVTIGESIALNGCCLTVVAIARDRLSFKPAKKHCSAPTWVGCRPGIVVNIERSLRAGDRLGGHFVMGHIDGLATLMRESTPAIGRPFGFAAG